MRKSSQGICDVQQQIRQMVVERDLAEQLAIDHMRKPGQGLPVGGVACSKCPFDIFDSQARVNVRIIGYVVFVVVGYENHNGEVWKKATKVPNARITQICATRDFWPANVILSIYFTEFAGDCQEGVLVQKRSQGKPIKIVNSR